MSRNSFSAYFAPASIGASYAVSKILMIRWMDPNLVLEADYKLLLLMGLFIGMIIRPIAQRIYWYRITSFLVLAWTLILVGSPGSFLERMMLGQSVGSLYWFIQLVDIIPALMVALLSSLIFVPKQFQLTVLGMKKRILNQITETLGIQLIIGGGIYVVLYLCFRVAFNPLEHFDQPFENLKLFFRSSASEDLNWFFLWGRGVLLIVAIFPIYCVLEGTPQELGLIFGTLVFVVGDFAPILTRISTVVSLELLDEIIQRLFIDFIFCYTIMFMFKKWRFTK